MARRSCGSRSLAAGASCTIAIAIGVVASASAHRLDEYLQAARIGIEPDRVDIELDLTPGADVARRLIAEIDRNHDGILGRDETRAYSNVVLRDVGLQVDDRPRALGVIDSRFPGIDAMLKGEGTIQLRLSAPVSGIGAGDHRLRFLNAHRADISVYLANALAPEGTHVDVIAQRRDTDQRQLEIDYVLHGVVHERTSLLPTVITAIALLVAVTWISRGQRARARCGSGRLITSRKPSS
jgi:hypothetical protein